MNDVGRATDAQNGSRVDIHGLVETPEDVDVEGRCERGAMKK
jgi:hypothetical protein